MSADNWRECPLCKRAREADLAERQAKLVAAYGMVPLHDFDAARADLETRRAKQPEQTWREDYEFWVEDEGPELFVSYRGSCKVCALSFKYENTMPIPLGPVPA